MNNRQRRKVKHKVRQGRERAKARAGSVIFGAGVAVEALVHAALHARADGQAAELAEINAHLADSRVSTIVDLLLREGLLQEIAGVWQRGWQPADLACAAGRLVGVHAQSLLIDMIAAQLRVYARATVDESWDQQLAAVGAVVWWEREERHFGAFAEARSLARVNTIECAIDVLYFLAALPPLPPLCPPPGQARRGSPAGVCADADSRLLQRVRSLLAKAEGTDFPEEAETYTAKAQELMTRHSIDYAMLSVPQTGKQEPTGRRIAVDNPYEAQKAVLLDVTATANQCHAVWSKAFGFSTVIGFAANLAATELLFTSLLLQATAALRAAGSQTDRRTVSFRRSFLTAYANRIGQRLQSANRSAVDTAIKDYGGNLLPVLASRADAVKEAVSQMFPSLSFHAMGAPTNRQGWIAGIAAADRAKLDQQLELEFS